MTRARDDGVILVNVLVVLGLAAIVVALMLGVGDLAIARSQRFGEASRALALIQAGEQSAIVALRRDMIVAPQVDHAGEPWGAIAQKPVAIEGGSFALAISDAQDRFNLNAVTAEAPEQRQALAAIVAALGLPEATTAAIADSVARDGPLAGLDELAGRAGLAPPDIARLADLATALPGTAPVNVNAASPRLLAILLPDPAQAAKLADLRRQSGFVTLEALAAAGITLPGGVGVTSDLYRVRTTVRIGGTLQSMESLLQRRRGAATAADGAAGGASDGRPEVVVVMRRNALAATPAAVAEPGA